MPDTLRDELTKLAEKWRGQNIGNATETSVFRECAYELESALSTHRSEESISAKVSELIEAMKEAAGDDEFWRLRFTAIMNNVPKYMSCCGGKYGLHMMDCAGCNNHADASEPSHLPAIRSASD